MARLRRLIKYFKFEEQNRSRMVTLDEGVRLDPVANHLVLVGPPFDTAPGSPAIARTWVTNPQSVKQWLSFHAVIEHATVGSSTPAGVPTKVETTGAGYRLGDGTDEYWWDGGAWAVNTSDFNTEDEIALNIATFPMASQSLQIIVNLTTTNPTVSPRLKEVKILYSTDVEFLEDIIYRSLVPSLRDNVRPITDFVIKAPGGTSIDLKNFPLDTPYNIVDVDSVYDRTNDPKHLIDLLSSYDSGTQIITLSSAITLNDLATIRLIYEPEVAVTTSQDYSEIAKVPVIILEGIKEVDMAPTAQSDDVVRKADGTAVKVPPPDQGDIEMTLKGLTDKGVDDKRLGDAIKAYFANNGRLTSKALDEDYSLWLIDEYDMQTPSGSADLHTGQLRFRIRDVRFYVRDSVDSFGVKRFLATGTEDFVIAE